MKQVLITAIICALSFITVKETVAQMVFDTLMLNELQVLGYKKDYSLSYKKTSIDSLMKEKLNYLDLGELLAGYSPVFIKSYGRGSLSTASFRGTGASHTQIQWDDFSLNSPMLGQVDLSLIPNTFFNEVDLYYGGGSLFKSSGALGGTVSLNNTSFFPQKPVLFIEQMAGSFNSFSTSAGLTMGKNKFSSSTRFSYQTSENDFTYYNDSILPAREVTQENADFSNFGFTQSFNFKPSIHHLITVTSWNQWNQRNIPPIMTNISNPTKEEQNDMFSRNIVSWIYQENNSHLEIKAAWFYEELIYEMNTDASNKDTIVNSQNTTNTFGLKANYEHVLSKGFRISAGLGYDYEYVVTNNYDGRKDRNRLSLYGTVMKDFAGRFKVNLLLRSELVDEDVLPVMPLFGFNYKILKNEDLFIRASISRNYHVPTLNDLYWYPGGNQYLTPEESYEIEGGVNYIKPIGKLYSLGADFSAYATRIYDWIQWVPSTNGYWSPENINEVYARGFEMSANLSKTGLFTFRVFIEYAFTKTTNESSVANEAGTAGQQLIYIPVQTGNAFVYAGYKGFYFTYNVLYTGERNTMMSQTGAVQAALPAYLMNDVSVGKMFVKSKHKLDLRIKINNLFDVNYQAVRLRAMAGRNFEIFLKYNLN